MENTGDINSNSGALAALRLRGAITDFAIVAILIGALMPLISGWVYPTYYHKMETPWIEWTRLIEAPFVVCELLILRLAIHRGLNLDTMIRTFPKDIKAAAAFLGVGLFASSLFLSAQPAQSLAMSLINVIHVLFALAIYYLIGRELKRHSVLNDFQKWLGIGLILLAIFTAWRFLLPISPADVPGGKIEWGHAVPGFISVRHFGSWTGALAAMFAAMLMFRERKPWFGSSDLFFMFAVGMTIWSGTRGAVAGVGVAMAIMLLARWRFPDIATIARLALLTIISTAFALFLLPYGDQTFVLLAMPDLSGQSAGQAAESLGTGRVEMWIAAWNEWLKSPLIGWGSGSTFWQLDLEWTHTQPHNALAQFLLTWGIIGTAGAFWLLGRAVVSAHKVAMEQQRLWPFLACVYCLLAMSLQEGMLHYPRFIMLTFALLAIIIAQGRRPGDTPDMEGREA